MGQKDTTILVLSSLFILFFLFSLYRPDLNLKGITGKTSAEDTLPSTGLVLRFDFESGSVADLVGGDNNGQLGSSPSVDNADPTLSAGSGKYGDALSFDGGDYVEVSTLTGIYGGALWTITAWFKPTANSGNIIYKGPAAGDKDIDYGIDISSGKARCFYKDNSGTINPVLSSNDIQLNDWNFVACTFNGNSIRNLNIHLNGIKTISTQAYNNPSTNNKFYVGSRGGYSGTGITGIIDSVRFYNSVLSDSDINKFYPFCGNGQIDAGEECDGIELDSKTCFTQNFTSGDLACDAQCKFDTGGCISAPPPPPPPAVSFVLTNLSDKIYINGNLIGNIKFTTSNQISNNTNITLNLSVNKNSFYSIMFLQQFMDYLNIQGTSINSEVMYNSGTYSLDVSKFNIVPNIASDAYVLSVVLTNTANGKITQTKNIAVSYSEGNIILYNVTLYNLAGGYNFGLGEIITCSAYMFDEKGIGGFNYKIWGYNKTYINPDYSNSISCPGTGFKQCSVNITATVLNKGNWTCAINATNSSNSYTLYSLKNITMINSAPKLKNIIPNKTWSGGVLGNTIDLKTYFEDPDNDNLTYGSTNPIPITVNITSGVVSFTASSNFTGNRSLYFTASDGIASVNSNLVILNVTGNISSVTGCVANWIIGNWSDCMPDNTKIRSVYDQNSCNNLSNKPLGNDSCLYQQQPIVNLSTTTQTEKPQTGLQKQKTEEGLTKEQKLLYSGILLGIFVVIAVIIILAAKFKGRKPKILEKPDLKKEAKPAKVEPKLETKVRPVIKGEIRPLNLEAMRDYAVRMVEKGAEPSKVRNMLLNAGWPKNHINESVDYAIVYNFVKKKLQGGMSKEHIKNILLAKKWNMNIVNDVLNKL